MPFPSPRTRARTRSGFRRSPVVRMRGALRSRGVARIGAMLSLALLGVAALPTVTASGAFFTDQASQTGNTAAAATLGEVSTLTATPSAAVAGPPAAAAGAKTNLSWASATGQAWATSNGVSSGVTYTVKRSETGDFTNATTVYEGAGTTFTDPGNLPSLRPATITVGGSHACGLSTAGTAYCWGTNTDGILGTGSSASTPASSPAKVDVSGVLKDKTLVSISAAPYHTCALDSAGAAYCWGNGTTGVLGNGTTAVAISPVAVTTSGVLAGKKLIAISAGEGLTCALDSKGAAYCWGDNTNGGLGYTLPSGLTQASTPGAVRVDKALAGQMLTTVSVGTGHACALDNAGLAYCWGKNIAGKLGNGTNGTTTSSSEPLKVTMPSGVLFQQIDGTADTVCAVSTTGTAYCWGYNVYRSTGSLGTVTTPTAVSNPTAGPITYNRVKTGGASTCGIASDNTTYCWGYNGSGQFGNGTSTTIVDNSNAIPKPIIPVSGDALFGKTLADVAVGRGSTACGADANGNAYCWGAGGSSQIGNGTATSINPKPVLVQFSTEPLAWLNVDFGSRDGLACGITTGNRAYCWGGTNANGQLGNGTTTAATRPVPVDVTGVLAGKTLVDVEAGEAHACALDSVGAVYCWGLGTYGALGSGASVSSAVPVAVKTSGALAGAKIASLVSMSGTYCVLTVAGKAFCWGSNSNRALGTTLPAGFASNEPVAVDTSGVLANKTLTTISGGTNSACVIDTSKIVYCWGNGTSGQLGNNTTDASFQPVAVTATGALKDKQITAVSVGAFNVCVLDQAGLAYCWGEGNKNANGIASTANNPTPVAVSGGRAYKSIDVHTYGACALLTTGPAYCWGDNVNGQLGSNNTTNASLATPTAITATGALSGQTIARISSLNSIYGEGASVCAVTTVGTMACWGANLVSNWGTPSATIASSPVPYATAATSTTIAVTRTYARCPSGEAPSATGTCGLDPAIAYNYQVGYKYYLWESPLKTAARTPTP